MNCRSCGEVVDPRRVELGYDYCLKDRCQQRCMKRVELAAVGVNKAADYYATAGELRPPRLPASKSTEVAEPDDLAPPAERRAAAPVMQANHHQRTTFDRLRDVEARLDRDLRDSYERFRRGEITAAEMERECERLTAAFNQIVRGENIRYRSMLRGSRLPRGHSR